MSSKHFFTNPEGLVIKSLRGTVSAKPSLSLIESDKVVFDSTHDPKKVSVLSGGGSGHEPAHASYVGKGMLAACVSGDVFASPSAKQVITGIESVPSSNGTSVVLCLL
jgi:dihydroxyacetone kinase